MYVLKIVIVVKSKAWQCIPITLALGSRAGMIVCLMPARVTRKASSTPHFPQGKNSKIVVRMGFIICKSQTEIKRKPKGS